MQIRWNTNKWFFLQRCSCQKQIDSSHLARRAKPNYDRAGLSMQILKERNRAMFCNGSYPAMGHMRQQVYVLLLRKMNGGRIASRRSCTKQVRLVALYAYTVSSCVAKHFAGVLILQLFFPRSTHTSYQFKVTSQIVTPQRKNQFQTVTEVFRNPSITRNAGVLFSKHCLAKKRLNQHGLGLRIDYMKLFCPLFV